MLKLRNHRFRSDSDVFRTEEVQSRKLLNLTVQQLSKNCLSPFTDIYSRMKTFGKTSSLLICLKNNYLEKHTKYIKIIYSTHILIGFYNKTFPLLCRRRMSKNLNKCLTNMFNKCFKWTKTHNSVVSTDPPILDPVFQDVRSRNYQMVTLRCTVLRSNPPRLTDIRWFRNGDFIRMPMPDLKEIPELKFKLEPTNSGSYECRVSNSAGTSTCTFNVSGE